MLGKIFYLSLPPQALHPSTCASNPTTPTPPSKGGAKRGAVPLKCFYPFGWRSRLYLFYLI